MRRPHPCTVRRAGCRSSPCRKAARPHHPAVSLDAAANPSPTNKYRSGRRRPRTRTRESSSPKAYWCWTSTPHKAIRSRRTGRKASANSLRNWACFRPRGAARRTASTVRHDTCSTRCPKASRGRAAPSRASTSCSPATGIPWSGRRSTRVAKCTAGTRPAAGLPARSPASAIWRPCHGSGWTTCANPTAWRT